MCSHFTGPGGNVSLSQGFRAKALLFLKFEAPERADAASGGL